MRKSALILAVIMVAAAPATAFAKKAKDPNAAGKKFVTTAFQQPVILVNGVLSPFVVARK